MTRTARWLLALAAVGTFVIELATGPPGWLALVDGAVALGLFALAGAVFDDTRRYALICAGAGIAWLLPGIVEGTSWLHRSLMVWAVLSFSDGRLRRPWGQLVVLGVAAAGLVPSPAARALALAALGVATLVVATAGRGPDGTLPVTRATAKTRAAVCMAAALWMPLLALPTGDSASVSGVQVGQIVELGYALLLLAAVLVLLVAVVSLEGEEAESVIALSEAEGTEATLARLRAVAGAAVDAPTHRALDSAIGLLEHNLALQQELSAAVADARVSRRRLAAAMERERRMLRTRLAERALPALAELRRMVEQVEGQDLDEPGRCVLEQCRSEVSAIADDLADLAEGLHPAALSRAGLRGFAEITAHSALPVAVHMPDERLPPDIEAALWFSCSEALANAVKHGDPSCVTVSGSVVDGWVAVEVHDDGLGGARLIPDGGLTSLQERLRAVDGTLTLASPLGGGTTVRMEVPLP